MNNKPHSYAIALSADYQYAEHVLTTIKSICCHNKNLHFYLFNKDFPQEWFDILNAQLRQIGNQITDIKIDNNELQNYPTLNHIGSEATYYRYFIPQYIDNDKVLYLDCDLVVNGSLEGLFATDLSNHFIAGVKDPIAQYFFKQRKFNAGVMLINNALWKQDNMTEKCLSLSNAIVHQLKDGDQDILNILFEHRWLKVSRDYNYQIGVDFALAGADPKEVFEDLGGVIPTIVHYSTAAKPWSNYTTRFRDLYWFYYQLTWQDIIAYRQTH